MNCKPAYYPSTAQKKYKYRRRFCHRGMFGNEELVKYIENKLLLSFIIKGYLELKVYVGGENDEQND